MLPGFFQVQLERVLSHRLYRQIESGFDGVEDTLGDGALLVDLDRLIEEL